MSIIGPLPDDTTTTEDTLGHDLRAACMRVARKVRHEASSLPPHHATVLAKLASQPRTAAELADMELVSAPSMSRTIGELEAAGLITREVSAQDRRKQICSLTEAGRATIDEVGHTRDSWMKDRLATLTPRERALLVEATDLLNRLVRS